MRETAMTRRDVRRAFGPAALGSLREQEQAIAIAAAGLASLQRDVLALQHDLRIAQRHLAELTAAVDYLRAVIDTRDASLMARLRWLVTGQ